MNTKFHDPIDEPLTEDTYTIRFTSEDEEPESEQLERRWEIRQ